MKLIASLVFTVLSLALCVLRAPALAASTSFNQQILPLNCVFQTVDEGTGTLYFVTPEACGIFVSPPVDTSPTTSTTDTTPLLSSSETPVVTDSSSFPVSSSNVIDLGQLADLTSESQPNVTIIAVVGQVYSFIIETEPSTGTGGSTLSTQALQRHVLQIDHIDLSNPARPTVTITLHSKPVTVTIAQGQTIIEDLTGDGKPNIGITANSITASGVKLTIWQIPPRAASSASSAPKVAQPTSQSAHFLNYALAAVASIASVAGYFILRQQRRP